MGLTKDRMQAPCARKGRDPVITFGKSHDAHRDLTSVCRARGQCGRYASSAPRAARIRNPALKAICSSTAPQMRPVNKTSAEHARPRTRN